MVNLYKQIFHPISSQPKLSIYNTFPYSKLAKKCLYTTYWFIPIHINMTQWNTLSPLGYLTKYAGMIIFFSVVICDTIYWKSVLGTTRKISHLQIFPDNFDGHYGPKFAKFARIVTKRFCMLFCWPISQLFFSKSLII